MADGGTVLQNKITGCTLDPEGSIVKIFYEHSYLLDCRTGELSNLYKKHQECTISPTAVKREIRRAKHWRMVWESCSLT